MPQLMNAARGLTLSALVLALAASAVLTADGASSSAEGARLCSVRKITTSGRSAVSPVVARRIAQTTWERRVRGTRALGPRYAQWASARERRTVCRKVEDRVLCLAVATPCRSGGRG